MGKPLKRRRAASDAVVLFKNQPQARRASLYVGVQYMAWHGFHAATISDVMGISKCQVYTACRQMQIRLRDYRDGRGPVAPKVMAQRPR